MTDNNINILDDANVGDDDKDSGTNSEDLKFVPPASIGSLARTAARVGPQAVKVGQKLYQGDVVGAAKEAGIESAEDLISQVAQAAPQIADAMGGIRPPTFTVDRGGSGGDVDGNSGYSNNYLQGHKLSIDAHPIEIRLNTGIEVDAYTPDYNSAEFDWHSTLQYTGLRFTFPGGSDTSLIGSYWNNVILNELWVVIQRNITFSVNSTGVTRADVSAYLNNLAYALQVFYFTSRYLVYTNQLEKRVVSKNDGILAIASTISSTDADNYVALRRVLNSVPIPPRLNDLMFYLMQHYTLSSLPVSPVIGFTPIAFDSTGPGLVNWSPIQAATLNLSSNSMINAASLIGRAIPAWYSTKLMSGAADFIHDPNFSTIWANTPYRLVDTNATPAINGAAPQTQNDDSRIIYSTFTDFLDGGAFALCTSFQNGSWRPSLVDIITSTTSASQQCNRIYFAPGVNKMHAIYGNVANTFMRPETYTITPGSGSVVIRNSMFGQRLWGVTPRTIVNSSYQLLDYVMSWDTITSRKDRGLDEVGPFNPSATKYVGPRSNDKPKRSKFNGKRKGGSK